MTRSHKILLGAAAMMLAGAAAFPGEVTSFYRSAYPDDSLKREALELCQRSNPGFVRFLASERQVCYAQMKHANGTI